MRIILLITIFISLLGEKSYATNKYFLEVKLLISNSQPLLNIGSDWDVDGLVEVSKESVDYKNILKNCVTNELDVIYKMFIPIYKKNLSIDELKILNRQFRTDVGKTYIALVTEGWIEIPLFPESSKELNDFVKSPELQKLEAVTFELAKKKNTDEFGGKYFNHCMDKADKYIRDSELE